MRIYFDTCCFNRPFDMATEDRVALEAEAVMRILGRIEAGVWSLVVSDAVLFEIRRNPDIRQRQACLELAKLALHHERAGPATTVQATLLHGLGFGLYDAAHLAFAASARSDVFLTVDDRLLRKARRLGNHVGMPVANPMHWLTSPVEGDRL